MLKPQYFTEGVGAKAVVATAGTAAAFTEKFCGSQPLLCALASDFNLILFLIGMMALDMVTGVLASRSERKRITSRRGGEGMYRKIAMIAVIAGAVIIGGVLADAGLPVQHLLYRWVTSWFIAVEGLSLYENAARTGLRLPTGLKTVIERILEKADGSIEDVAETALPGTQKSKNV